MNALNWIFIAILAFCVLISAPGFVIAVRKSAWRAIVVNFVIYLVVGTAVVLLPFLQNKLERGTWTPESWPFVQPGYHLWGVLSVGFYWLIFQVIGITAATVIRRRRRRRSVR